MHSMQPEGLQRLAAKINAGKCMITCLNISRDIHYIQREIRKSTDNYGEHLFEIYRNTLLGLDETVKKLWQIIDSLRTDSKESSEPSLVSQNNKKCSFMYNCWCRTYRT